MVVKHVLLGQGGIQAKGLRVFGERILRRIFGPEEGSE
jgi:hypothetical protein